MIGYIIGTVKQIDDNSVILENNGIGYIITMPISSICRISPGEEEVKVFTYMAVREDDLSLFGFLSKAELDMFKMLIQVSGVGPKGAVGILSSIGVEELRMAIAAEDSKLIAASKGIGTKTAQKIVVELKSKIDKEMISSGNTVVAAAVSSAEKTTVSEALEVLEALGFSRSAGVKAINQVENPENLGASELVSQALKFID